MINLYYFIFYFIYGKKTNTVMGKEIILLFWEKSNTVLDYK